MITTTHGTRIEVDADGYVTLTKGDDTREVGQIYCGGFETTGFDDYALRPETLRAIADLIEQQ